MNLGKEQSISECCGSEQKPESTIIYPELRISDQIDLLEGLTLGQTFQALIVCKVTNIEAHTKDAQYLDNKEGSSLCLSVTDFEIAPEKTNKPRGAIALFNEITK